jgi:hypothetical protein
MAKDWRGTGSVKGRTTADSSAKNSKQGKIFLLLAIMLALVGAIIAMLLFYGSFHPPHFVSIPVTEYDLHYPPNAFALQDGEALRVFFDPERSKDAFEHQERDRFVRALQGLSAHADGPVVLHVSAHALARGEEVYILPGDALPDDPNTWLALTDILRYLGECPSAHKLLILDVMEPIANARLGVLVDEVAARTAEILKKQLENEKRLLVLCPCSPGQVSQISEEMGTSVFAYYLAAGLSGLAERYNPKEASDSRVSVQELAEFLKARVQRWVRENRGLTQTPALYGNAKDFHLVAVTQKPIISTSESPESETEAATPKEPAYPAWLTQAWAVHDLAWQRAEYRLDPQAFRRLEGLLLRAEERWRGKVDEEKIRIDLDRAVSIYKRRSERAAGEVGRVLHPEGSKPPNLTVAYQEWKAKQPVPPPAEKPGADGKAKAGAETPPPANPEELVGEALRKLFAQVDRLQSLSGKDRDEANKALDKAKMELTDQFKSKPELLAWCVFTAAGADPYPNRPKLELAADLLAPLQAALPALRTYRETEILRRLADLKPDSAAKWPVDSVVHVLRMTRLAEKATLATPRVFPWVRHLLGVAARSRQHALQALFDPDPIRDGPSGPLVEGAERKFEEIDRAVQTIQEAQETLDRALVRLPAYMQYLNHQVELDLADAGWTGAVDSVNALLGMLSRPLSEGAPPLQQLRGRTDELLDALRRLDEPFQPAVLEQLQQQAKKKRPTIYQEVESRLSTGCLSAADRARLWLLQRDLGNQLHAATLKRDQEDDAAQRRTPHAAKSDGSSAEATPGRIAARRARLVLDIFRVGGMEQLEELQRDWQSPGLTESSWRAGGEKIQRAWGKSLPSQYEQKLADQNWQAADRLGRALNPFDLKQLDNEDLARNPTVEQAVLEARQFRAWLDAQ